MIAKYLFSGSIYAFTGKMATSVLNIILYALLSRMLDPIQMGGFFLIFSYSVAVSIVVLLGLHRALVKIIPEYCAEGNYSGARYSIILAFLAVLAMTVLVSFILYFWFDAIVTGLLGDSSFADAAPYLIIWSALLAFQVLIVESFRAYKKIVYATIFDGLLSTAFTLLVVLVIWLFEIQAGLRFILFLMFVCMLISNVIGLYRLYAISSAQILSRSVQPKSSVFIPIVLPMYFTTILLYIVTQSDLWIVGSMSSIEDAAIYGAVSKLVVLMGFSLAIINSVVMPLVSEYWAVGKLGELERIIRQAAAVAGLPSLLVFVVICFFSEEVLNFVYGERFITGSNVLIILAFGQLVNVMSGSSAVILMMTGGQRELLSITLLNGILGVFGCVLLVEPYGIEGVALSSAAVLVIQNLLMVWRVRARLNIWSHVDYCGLFNSIRKRGFVFGM